MKLDEMKDIVQQKVSFKELANKIAQNLKNKGVDETDLCENSDAHLLPADKILKFLKNLKQDIQNREDMKHYLQDIQYATHKINDRSLYKSTQQ